MQLRLPRLPLRFHQLIVGSLLCSSAAACSNLSGTSTTPSAPVGIAPLAFSTLMQSVSSDAGKACTTYTGERVYADQPPEEQSATILVFKANAGTTATPLCTITYSGLHRPGGFADDAGGKLWVMDSESVALMAFPRGANGGGPPAQTIAGANTQLIGGSSPGAQGIAVDQSGNVWVPCWYDYNHAFGYLTAFANTANGNVAPVATIGFGDKGVAEHIGAPIGVTFDTKGNLYVAEFTVPGKVVIFKPPFTDTSRPVATWILPGQDFAQYVSADGSGNVYVGGFYSIDIYKGGLASKGVVWHHINPPSSDGFYDVKADPQGRIYAAMIAGMNGQVPNAIGILPKHATSFAQAHAIESPEMCCSPGTLALGS